MTTTSGVVLGATITFVNSSGNTIVGDTVGITGAATDTLGNDGVITGMAGDGVDLGATAVISNTGIIQGAAVGLTTGATAILTNTGTITGSGGDGAVFGATPTISNSSQGIIQGSAAGLTAGATLVLINDGMITGSQANGVNAAATGYITNNTGATILGAITGVVDGAGAIVTNAGVISGQSTDGIDIAATGSVTNMAGGVVHGGVSGITGGATATVINAGLVVGDTGEGIALGATGNITNSVTGTIQGAVGIAAGATAVIANLGNILGMSGDGVDMSLGGVLVNFGTIVGENGISVHAGGTVGNTVVVQPGSVFYGAIVGDANGTNTLELGAGSGLIDNFDTNVVNFQYITIDANAHWVLTGNVSVPLANITIGAGGSLTYGGQTLGDPGTQAAAIESSILSSTAFHGFPLSNITVSSGAVYVVSAGQVLSGATILPGAVVSAGSATLSGAIVDNGLLIGGTIAPAATLSVMSGATASAVTVGSGGTSLVSAIGTTISTIVSNAGLEMIFSGGTSLSATVGSGGVVSALSGGMVVNATVRSGGTESLLDGSITGGATILSGGTLIANGGATLSGMITDNGTIVGGVLGSGATLTIGAGGVTSATTFADGSVAMVQAGGTALEAVVGSGATESVAANGVSTDNIISGGTLNALSGGLTAGPSGIIVRFAAGTTGGVLNFGNETLDFSLSGGITAGNTVNILSGGTVTAGTVITGTLNVSAGGLADPVVSSGGNENVSSGGTADPTTILSGGTETVYAGGTSLDNIIAGGTLIASAGGLQVGTSGYAVSFQSGTSGGIVSFGAQTLDFSSYVISAGNTVNVLSRGTVTGIDFGAVVITSGGSAANLTISTGGTESVQSGGVATNTLAGGAVTVLSGGALTLSAAADNLDSGSVLLSGGLLILGGAVSPSTVISSFTATDGTGDSIDLTGIGAYSSATTYTVGTNTITVTNGAASMVLDVAGATAGAYRLAADKAGTGILVTTCFLEGTLITAGDLEIPVEDLKVGQLITTLMHGQKVLKPVIWVGYRSVKSGDLPEDEAHPVRIRMGAFADNVPQRDLLITPEHSVFVNGQLIPVRMLVNGRSILIDRGISSFTFYHVELDTHAILLAEGLATESYLDTGNRSSFVNANPVALQPDLSGQSAHKSWETHAAAPLSVSRDAVEPIWQQLLQRAMSMGLKANGADRVLTAKPNVRLLINHAREIWPESQQDNQYVFSLPADTHTVRLLSRSARPADVVGPFLDDRRQLGVCVGDVFACAGTVCQALDLTADDLSGWYGLEGEAGAAPRWTNGDAQLVVTGLSDMGHLDMLVVNVVSNLIYPLETPVATAITQVA